MQKVVFIIKNQKGRFGLHMSAIVYVDGPENDPVLYSLMVGPKYDTIIEAQAAIEIDRKSLEERNIKIYLNPINSSPDGLTWLSELEAQNV